MSDRFLFPISDPEEDEDEDDDWDQAQRIGLELEVEGMNMMIEDWIDRPHPVYSLHRFHLLLSKEWQAEVERRVGVEVDEGDSQCRVCLAMAYDRV